jgi:hypothetical protein
LDCTYIVVYGHQRKEGAKTGVYNNTERMKNEEAQES